LSVTHRVHFTRRGLFDYVMKIAFGARRFCCVYDSWKLWKSTHDGYRLENLEKPGHFTLVWESQKN